MKIMASNFDDLFDEIVRYASDIQITPAGVFSIAWNYEDKDSANHLIDLFKSENIEIETGYFDDGELAYIVEIPSWLFKLKIEELKQEKCIGYWNKKQAELTEIKRQKRLKRIEIKKREKFREIIIKHSGVREKSDSNFRVITSKNMENLVDELVDRTTLWK